MLPFSLSGATTIEQQVTGSNSVEDALRSIITRLESEKASHLSRTGNRVDFKGGLVRLVPSWNQLVAISRGEIRVEREPLGLSVRYEIWFTQLLILVTLGVVAVLAPGVSAAPNLSPLGKVAILVLAWTWLAGGNIAITAFRFRRFLKRAIESEQRAA